MSIEVEFFGIPRLRAGVRRVTMSADQATQLSDLFARLHHECPGFAAACLDGNQLRDGFIASIEGEVFTSQDVLVECGNSVLIMSADAGG